MSGIRTGNQCLSLGVKSFFRLQTGNDFCTWVFQGYSRQDNYHFPVSQNDQEKWYAYRAQAPNCCQSFIFVSAAAPWMMQGGNSDVSLPQPTNYRHHPIWFSFNSYKPNLAGTIDVGRVAAVRAVFWRAMLNQRRQNEIYSNRLCGGKWTW